MLKYVITGYLIVAGTVVIHALGTVLLGRFISQRKEYRGDGIYTDRPLLFIVAVVLVLLFILSIEIFLWAVAYLVLLPPGELGSAEEAIYFSFITFTTLGYGDVTISEGWRILTGIEALNGILMAGWTTAMLFLFVQKMWRGSYKSQEVHISQGGNSNSS